MSFLLDTMVISYFLQARRQFELAAAAASQPCAIAEAVMRELEADPQHRQLFSGWMPTSNLRVLPVFVESVAASVLSEIEIGLTTSKGRGERASIALTAADPALTLVTMDKGAVWIALRELWERGERLIGLSVFLRRLVHQGALGRDAAEDVMAASGHRRPTWWARWRSGASDGSTHNEA